MPRYRYLASGATGGLQKGVLEATGRAEAVRALGSRGLVVLELNEEAGAAAPSGPDLPSPPTRVPAAPPRVGSSPPCRPDSEPRPAADSAQTRQHRAASESRLAANPARQGRVEPVLLRRPLGRREAALFLRQLSVMFEAGIPLHRAVDCLAQQALSRRPGAALQQVAGLLAQGVSLSQSLSRSGAFSPLVVGVIRAGEESGMLGLLLDRLATLEEQEYAFEQQVWSRLSYPVGVAVCMIVATAFLCALMSRVVGALGALAQGNPWLQLLRQPWLTPMIVLVPAGLGGLLGYLWSRPATRTALEGALLRLPVMGPLLRRMESARLCRILAVLSASGIRLDRSLNLTAGTTRSPAALQALQRIQQRVQDGAGLAEAFKETGFFPPEVYHMAAAGEASGRLPAMLGRVGEYMDQQVTRFLESAVAALEPALLGLLGVLVGVTMLATFGPIYGALGRL